MLAGAVLRSLAGAVLLRLAGRWLDGSVLRGVCARVRRLGGLPRRGPGVRRGRLRSVRGGGLRWSAVARRWRWRGEAVRGNTACARCGTLPGVYRLGRAAVARAAAWRHLVTGAGPGLAVDRAPATGIPRGPS
ncbi:hypothetical protein N599_16605 [Saccharopolyspora erythraea D]|nr:hypothetical protein N599_16605 [Saccharopolyspora erythraea D]